MAKTMRVKRLTLNGYKRFRKLTIDLGENPNRIVALVGPNGCGKSSILEGMLYLANAHGPLGQGTSKGKEYHSLDADPGYSYQQVSLDFDQGPFSKVHQTKNQSGMQQTIFSFRSPYRYNTNLKIAQTSATPAIRLNNYGAGGMSELDNKMDDNYRRLYAFFHQYMTTADCRPSEAKAKVIGDLNQSLSACLGLKITDLGNIDSGKGTLYFGKPDHQAEFEFNVLSSGEKEVVDILLDLYLRREVYNDTVFMIDEPELHLNTSIQRRLLIEINKLIGPNCQLWVATHSIGFLRALQQDLSGQCSVIHLPPDTDWAQASHTLRPMKLTRSKWQQIFDTALDDLTGLISPKQLIYCEGRDRPDQNGAERGLDATVFNEVFSPYHIETLFISSGGNTELDQRSEIAIAILSKVFAEIEIFVVKDRDMASGAKTTEGDRQLYLENHPANHRVLLRWELENYLYDKEVLQAYCTANQLTFDETAYDAFVTDVVNQNLKDETGRIKNICGLTGNVNPKQFKINLAKCVTREMAVYQELESCIFKRK